MAIIIFHIISIFIFYLKKYDNLKDKINYITIAIKNLTLNKNQTKKNVKKLNDINKKKFQNKNIIKTKNPIKKKI